MKRLLIAMTFVALSGGARLHAHDEGHGPKLTDMGQQGGVVSPVIDKKEMSKGVKANVVYKAELVRFDDGKVSVYLYDNDMEPLDLAKFKTEAKGVVETEKKGKISTVPFALKLEEDAFTGKAPKPSIKPFNIDVTLTEGDRELLAAFDNLD